MAGDSGVDRNISVKLVQIANIIYALLETTYIARGQTYKANA